MSGTRRAAFRIASSLAEESRPPGSQEMWRPIPMAIRAWATREEMLRRGLSTVRVLLFREGHPLLCSRTTLHHRGKSEVAQADLNALSHQCLFRLLLCAGSRPRGAGRIKTGSVELRSCFASPDRFRGKNCIHVNCDCVLHVASVSSRMRDHHRDTARLSHLKD